MAVAASDSSSELQRTAGLKLRCKAERLFPNLANGMTVKFIALSKNGHHPHSQFLKKQTSRDDRFFRQIVIAPKGLFCSEAGFVPFGYAQDKLSRSNLIYEMRLLSREIGQVVPRNDEFRIGWCNHQPNAD